MKPGKICPACERDIGVWPVFVAALPTRVTCPHCKAQLQYADTGVLVATLVAVFLTCAAGAFFFLLRFYPLARFEFAFLGAALILVLWLPFELFVAIYLRNSKSLRKVDKLPAHRNGTIE